MTRDVRMFAGVAISRRVAAQRRAALLAGAEMNPRVADLHTLPAFANFRLLHGSDCFDVRANGHWFLTRASARCFLTVLSRSGEGHLHAGDSHAAFAHGSGATFDRPRADIARSKNGRQAGLEWAGRPFVLFPSGRVRNERTCFDKSFFVALDLEWQPLCAWSGADHGKNRRCSEYAPLACFCIFQLGFFEHSAASHFSDLGVKENLDVLLRFHPPRKIARHFREIVATDYEQHFAGAIGKEHRSLASRIATARDDDGLSPTNLTFQRRRRVINAHIFKLFASFRIESAVIGASRDQNAFCPEHGAATFDLETGAIFVTTIITKRECLSRR